jgi:hypothetical protein
VGGWDGSWKQLHSKRQHLRTIRTLHSQEPFSQHSCLKHTRKRGVLEQRIQLSEHKAVTLACMLIVTRQRYGHGAPHELGATSRAEIVFFRKSRQSFLPTVRLMWGCIRV